MDVTTRRTFVLSRTGEEPVEKHLSFGELLHTLAVSRGLQVDAIDLSPREAELVDCVTAHRDRLATQGGAT